jgi:hypothetical protein
MAAMTEKDSMVAFLLGLALYEADKANEYDPNDEIDAETRAMVLADADNVMDVAELVEAGRMDEAIALTWKLDTAPRERIFEIIGD